MGMFFVLQNVVSLRKYIWQADKFLQRECSRRKIIELENDERNLCFKALRKNGTGVAQSVLRVGYRLDAPSFELRKGQEIFRFSKTSRLVLWPTQPHNGSLSWR
jgi:hypothetical protein